MTEKKAYSGTKTILIIEDDGNILFALSTLLEGEGFSVYSAENGAVALKLLKVIEMPRLILLDMVMPVMDGWQFAVELRNEFHGKVPPIIVMTAAGDVEKRAKDVQATEWIGKPFVLETLLELLEKYY